MAGTKGLFVVLAALLAVTGVNSSCEHSSNQDMVEYVCSGGRASDLASIPDAVEKIRIIRMNLPVITRDTFSRFGNNLWVLSCSNCGISDIEPGAFQTLVNLQQLSLDSNYLTTLKGSWFQGLEYLTFLDVNYNRIDKIEDDVFENLPNLVDFRISGNRLECINLNALSNLSELKRIFISENPYMKCPNALSKFLEDRSVTFERDPEWARVPNDLISVAVPPVNTQDTRTRPTAVYEATLPPYRERYYTSTSTTERPTEERRVIRPYPVVPPTYPPTYLPAQYPTYPQVVVEETTYQPEYLPNYKPQEPTIPWYPAYPPVEQTTQPSPPVEETTHSPEYPALPTHWYPYVTTKVTPTEISRPETDVESQRSGPNESFDPSRTQISVYPSPRIENQPNIPNERYNQPQVFPRPTDQRERTDSNTNRPSSDEVYWDNEYPYEAGTSTYPQHWPTEKTRMEETHVIRPYPQPSKPEVVAPGSVEFPSSVEIDNRQRMQNITAVIPIQPTTTDKPLPSCKSGSVTLPSNLYLRLVIIFILLKCFFEDI
ncbi:uncharacterized protein [Prorops nasuta]|uniref:uncharacterized protein n=1 Tax=Prorops nasuta TaxID=863751 RepID=UPI0034CD43F0